MQRLCGLMRKASQLYNLIEPQDSICVGVSGGKDSMALAVGLKLLQGYLGVSYNIHAVTLDPCFGGVQGDYSEVARCFEQYDIPYTIVRTDIGQIVFDIRKEANPCSLCAKMRRGILHDTAKSLGCNKVALGHHADDAVETFYMNLWNEGRIGCFAPSTYMSRKDITVIRPMVLAEEHEVIKAARGAALPIVKSACPVDKTTEREVIKQFIVTKLKTDHAFKIKAIGAMQRAGIDGWGIK